MVHRIYKSVIRPILTYVSVVWWTAIDKKCNVITLQTTPMRTTPTRALETILYIHPVDIQIKFEAAITALRLKAMNEWIDNGHYTPHENILQATIGHSINHFESDRIPETRAITLCEILIPDRDSWSSGTLAHMPPGNCCYTDGSRLAGKTGLGLFIEEPGTEISLRLPDHNTILQAEVQAITECLRWLSSNSGHNNINIMTDSKHAINAITSKTVTSKTVLECIKTINNFSRHGLVRIIWVPGHSGVIGNEIANQLARRATDLINIDVNSAKPFSASRLEMRSWAEEAHKTLWNNERTGKNTKILWGDPNEDKTKQILTLNKKELSRLIGILTGHLNLQSHLHKIGCSGSSRCRACGEDNEPLEHFLCHCPAFACIRTQFLKNDTIPELNDLRGCEWKILKDFCKNTEFLEEYGDQTKNLRVIPI